MLKLLTASTAEIDDPEAAVTEILEQIDMTRELMSNSVGIITCYYEFIETGVLAALRESLPFDIIGCTVMGSATRKGYSLEQLSLAVLTSDDIHFSLAISTEISRDNIEKPLQDVWQEARSKLPGDPGLIFTFAPMISDVSGDSQLRRLSKICGDLPLFGTLSNDSSPNCQESRTFLNEKVHPYRMALLLLYGPVNPRFYVASITPTNIQHQKAIITETESDDYIIKKVNNIPFIEYLASIGVQRETIAALSTLPFMVDYNDGTKPVALAIYSILQEGALCGGKMPTGSRIAFTEIDYDSIMETAESAIKAALEDVKKNGANGLLAIPCLTRCFMISPHSEDEMRKTSELIGSSVPFMLFYSGGEICPVYSDSGAMVNRFHNYTYTLVVL